MDMTEKTLTTQEVYHGRIIRVRRDEVLLPNGHTSVREVVEHPGGVGILALEDDGSVLLVRQYRSGIGQESLEIPAGKRDPGETPEDCGRRELEEECGLIAGGLEPLATLYPTPAYCDEKIWIFTAKELTPGHVHPDED